MKYCPDCGKAEVEGMKFCPQCGRSLTGSNFEEKKRYVSRPEVPSKKSSWFERHSNWTLLLAIICAPFILYGILVALIMLGTLFPPSIGEAIARGAITATPLGYIVIVIHMVRWHRSKRRQSKTIADCDQVIELDSSNAAAYYERGEAHAEVDDYGQAIADYSKAIQLDAGHALAYFGRAYAYGEIGEYDKAIADYGKAIELDPTDCQAYYNRGLDYQNKGELPKAVSDLEKCIGLSTDPELTQATQQALSEMKHSP